MFTVSTGVYTSIVSALSFVASYTLCCGPWWLCCFSCYGFVLWACHMTHKLSSARAEMILSYHLLPQQIFFTHNWNLSRHCFVVVWLFCLLCGLFLFVFVFGVVFAFGSLCFGSCSLVTWQGNRTMYRSSTSFLLRPPQLWPLRELIN